jgi:hypothetical protein
MTESYINSRKSRVLAQPRRANRPAVDAGGFDAHEQPPIEAGIAGRNRAVAGDAVHIHHAILVHSSRHVSRFSDITILDYSCQKCRHQF